MKNEIVEKLKDELYYIQENWDDNTDTDNYEFSIKGDGSIYRTE